MKNYYPSISQVRQFLTYYDPYNVLCAFFSTKQYWFIFFISVFIGFFRINCYLYNSPRFKHVDPGFVQWFFNFYTRTRAKKNFIFFFAIFFAYILMGGMAGIFAFFDTFSPSMIAINYYKVFIGWCKGFKYPRIVKYTVFLTFFFIIVSIVFIFPIFYFNITKKANSNLFTSLVLNPYKSKSPRYHLSSDREHGDVESDLSTPPLHGQEQPMYRFIWELYWDWDQENPGWTKSFKERYDIKGHKGVNKFDCPEWEDTADAWESWLKEERGYKRKMEELKKEEGFENWRLSDSSIILPGEYTKLKNPYNSFYTLHNKEYPFGVPQDRRWLSPHNAFNGNKFHDSIVYAYRKPTYVVSQYAPLSESYYPDPIISINRSGRRRKKKIEGRKSAWAFNWSSNSFAFKSYWHSVFKKKFGFKKKGVFESKFSGAGSRTNYPTRIYYFRPGTRGPSALVILDSAYRSFYSNYFFETSDTFSSSYKYLSSLPVPPFRPKLPRFPFGLSSPFIRRGNTKLWSRHDWYRISFENSWLEHKYRKIFTIPYFRRLRFMMKRSLSNRLPLNSPCVSMAYKVFDEQLAREYDRFVGKFKEEEDDTVYLRYENYENNEEERRREGDYVFLAAVNCYLEELQYWDWKLSYFTYDKDDYVKSRRYRRLNLEQNFYEDFIELDDHKIGIRRQGPKSDDDEPMASPFALPVILWPMIGIYNKWLRALDPATLKEQLAEYYHPDSGREINNIIDSSDLRYSPNFYESYPDYLTVFQALYAPGYHDALEKVFLLNVSRCENSTYNLFDWVSRIEDRKVVRHQSWFLKAFSKKVLRFPKTSYVGLFSKINCNANPNLQLYELRRMCKQRRILKTKILDIFFNYKKKYEKDFSQCSADLFGRDGNLKQVFNRFTAYKRKLRALDKEIIRLGSFLLKQKYRPTVNIIFDDKNNILVLWTQIHSSRSTKSNLRLDYRSFLSNPANVNNFLRRFELKNKFQFLSSYGAEFSTRFKFPFLHKGFFFQPNNFNGFYGVSSFSGLFPVTKTHHKFILLQFHFLSKQCFAHREFTNYSTMEFFSSHYPTLSRVCDFAFNKQYRWRTAIVERADKLI